MKEIKLTQGRVTLVDDDDYEYLSQWKWRAHRDGCNWYAIRNVKIEGKRTTIKMHQSLIGNKPGLVIDHIDGDGLNNQRSNLQHVRQKDNVRKQRRRGGTSSFRGVYWHKNAKKWRAQIQIDRKSYHLGLFSEEKDAAREYDAAAREHFGEFANLNFTEGATI